MKLTLHRKYLKEDYTIGNLYVDGVFFCNTLEDKTRDLNKDGKLIGEESKVYALTSIPYGTYKIILNESPKFKRVLPRLLNVPHFSGILIHRGNIAKDTAGCILVGENKIKGMVINSAKYEIALIYKMQEAVKRGEEITIEIQ